MYFIYNIAVYIASFFVEIIAIFNKKLALFSQGRKTIFTQLKNHFNEKDTIIWFHCASLGEFEQGRPILEKIKEQTEHYNSQFYNCKLLVTFFSPSGYEVRKKYKGADVVTYLPLDTKRNVKKFVKIVNPTIAIFVKYEFWPNLLRELKDKQITTILVSGIFRKNQTFFKRYGEWMRKSLTTFDHFFVQNSTSLNLLKEIGFNNATLSGDTRFDRVYEITQQQIKLDFVKQFKNGKTALVAGSTWPKDESLLIEYINNSATSNENFIIAPHTINPQTIQKLKLNIDKKVVLYSEKKGKDLSRFQVLIIDTIGILTHVYKYSDIAYVGGGFGTGIHNILEPATFGVPILIGPNYHKFNEALDLIRLKGCISIENVIDLEKNLSLLFNDEEIRINRGTIAKKYILDNIGSTKIIMKYINTTVK